MSKHTPGPWVVSEGRSIQAAWETHEIVQVCSISVSHWSTDPTHDDVPLNRQRNTRMALEATANSHLIAASPELLEALKAMLNALPRSKVHPAGYTNGKQDKANDLARAAIAKAEGVS